MSLTRRSVVAGSIVGLCSSVVWPQHAALDMIVRSGAQLRKIYDGGRWCEGPAWDRRTNSLVFSDVRSNRMMRIGDDGIAQVIRDPSAFANGNAFDAQGRLVTCEHLNRRIVRLEPNGQLTVLADRFEGKRLNSPNDLAISQSGMIWFTDPTFGIDNPQEGSPAPSEQQGRFVFRLEPNGSITKVAEGFVQPNGIAFSPDEQTLYVSEAAGNLDPSLPMQVRAFSVIDGRWLDRGRVFADVTTGGVDGLTVDENGNVYAATGEGVQIWTPLGQQVGMIEIPGGAANVEFGGRDNRTLFICCGTAIYQLEMTLRGVERDGLVRAQSNSGSAHRFGNQIDHLDDA